MRLKATFFLLVLSLPVYSAQAWFQETATPASTDVQTLREKCLVDAAQASQNPALERKALQCVQVEKEKQRAA